MSEARPRTLLLALGNDLLGDDGAGPMAARALAQEFAGEVNTVESAEAGMALVELLEGYERALLLDVLPADSARAGEVIELGPEDFRAVRAPSPHYAGLPEALEMARRLGIMFPREVRVLALAVENPYEIREGLSPSAERALPAYVERARQILRCWVPGDRA